MVSAPSGNALVADVGGSNARFGWVDATSGCLEHVRTLPASDFSGLADAASHYLDDLRRERGLNLAPPVAAAVAVATAVTSDRVELTNSQWSFSQAEAKAALALQRLHVLNDFEALALALPHLGAQQLRCHGPAMPPITPVAGTTLAVVGPGTGLGVASLVHTGVGWQALPGEGGHSTIAAVDDFEAAVLAHVRRQFNHVSAERLLSGIGLPVLCQAVAAVCGAPASPTHGHAPAIVERGLANEGIERRTLEVFCALLGSFSGNVALTVGARGGLFIGGGIVPRLGDYFFGTQFRARFEAKGRLASYMAAIPTAVITDTLAALTGAMAVLGLAGGTAQGKPHAR